MAALTIVFIAFCSMAFIAAGPVDMNNEETESREQNIALQDTMQADQAESAESGEVDRGNRKKRQLCIRRTCYGSECNDEYVECGCQYPYDDCAPGSHHGGYPGSDPYANLCNPGQFYCGRQLTTMGYNKSAPNALYQCDYKYDGQYHGMCSEGCSDDRFSVAHCKCKEGTHYCGFELRFKNLQPRGYLNDHTLYRCTADGSVIPVSQCWQCQSHASAGGIDGHARCGVQTDLCEPGRRYCGRELAEMRYRGAQPESLYICGSYGGRVDFLQECESGCVKGFDKANPAKCGHDLVAKKPRDPFYDRFSGWGQYHHRRPPPPPAYPPFNGGEYHHGYGHGQSHSYGYGQGQGQGYPPYASPPSQS